MSSSNEPVRPTTPKIPGAFQPLEPDPATPGNPSVSPQRSLARAVYDRRHEYTRQQKIRIKIGTWNVAACSGVEKDLKGWFVQGQGVSEKLADLDLSGNKPADKDGDNHKVESFAAQEARRQKNSPNLPLSDQGSLPGEDEIGLYVLGLQEVRDISSFAEAMRPYNDPSISQKWKAACEDALPKGYDLVSEQQLNGILLLIYSSPTIAPTISNVSSTHVGTGLMGYMGNKGGAITRIVLGDSTRLVFVDSHLAAGTEEDNLTRRNWDSSQIVQRTKFEPIDHGNGVVDEVGDTIGDEDFCFWFGDLNYRLSTMPGEDVRRLLTLHTRNEYDIQKASIAMHDQEQKDLQDSTSSADTGSTDTLVSPSNFIDEDEIDPDYDPASLQTTLSSLLPHDQLHEQMRKRKAFHEGWREGPIKFLPTYKYDIGSVGVFDSSEKKRAPSWCDRILYRTRKDYLAYKEKAKQEDEAKKKDEEMKKRGLDEGDDVIFDYDPETDGTYDEYSEEQETVSAEQVVQTKSGYNDRILLEYYTSHQRVLSSDHKPLDAIFQLTYDAVDRQQRMAIQAEIAKELDKDENESRPTITLVVDHAEVKNGSAEGIDYGEIKYDDPKIHNITVANTGRVAAKVGFVKDLGSDEHEWLRVSFDDKSEFAEYKALEDTVIEPGETMNIALTIHVKSPAEARSLSRGSTSLEDVRVLRVTGGRDHFITLRGNWLNSCFGLSLEELIRVPEAGVRSCKLSREFTKQEVKWSAPRELFRLTEALEESLERAVAEWGMKDLSNPPPWSTSGWPFLESTHDIPTHARSSFSAEIREALDTNAPFPHPEALPAIHNVETLAYTLLQFLGSLDGGIIDSHLWATITHALNEREKLKKPLDPEITRSTVLDAVSPSPTRSVAFTFITFMLARVVGEVAPMHDVAATAQLNPKSVKPAEALLGRVRGASEDPRVVKRREVERRFAEEFERVMFRVEGEKGKEERKGEERRRGVLSVFMHGKWGDG